MPETVRNHPLELSRDEMRRLADLAVEQLVAHVQSLPDQACGDTSGGAELARSLNEPLPETGAASCGVMPAATAIRPSEAASP